jgi:signal transduction histidine kinase
MFFCVGFLGLLGDTFAQTESSTNTPADYSTAPILHPVYGVGSWIWAAETTNKQAVRFWRDFQIPGGSPVAEARLRISADNGYQIFLDGREIGQGSDYRTLSDFDLRELLSPGKHVFAIAAFNDHLAGGMTMGLRVILEDGRSLELASDKSWRLVPLDEDDWQKRTVASESWPHAKVIAAYMTGVWRRKPDHLIKVPTLRPPPPLRFWQTGAFQITLLSVSAVVVLVCLRLMNQLTAQNKAQRLLQRERARIARDIHDDLGAGLTQLVLLGEVAKSELPERTELRGQINQLCDNARGLSTTLDEIVWAVNSRRDTLKDFASYVCKYAHAFLQTTSIRCRLDVEPDMPAIGFDLPIRRNLFQAVKEAINNAARHSGATEMFLRIHRQGAELVVTVEDNGKGFDAAAANPERNGLTNMAQRMEEVGGSYRVTSKPGAGCRVEFKIPLEPTSRWRAWFIRFRKPHDAEPVAPQTVTAPPAAATGNQS